MMRSPSRSTRPGVRFAGRSAPEVCPSTPTLSFAVSVEGVCPSSLIQLPSRRNGRQARALEGVACPRRRALDAVSYHCDFLLRPDCSCLPPDLDRQARPGAWANEHCAARWRLVRAHSRNLRFPPIADIQLTVAMKPLLLFRQEPPSSGDWCLTGLSGAGDLPKTFTRLWRGQAELCPPVTAGTPSIRSNPAI